MAEAREFIKRNFDTTKFSGATEGILIYHDWKEYLRDKMSTAECLHVLDNDCWIPNTVSLARDRLEYDTLLNHIAPLNHRDSKKCTQLESSIQKRTERLEKVESLGKKLLIVIKECCGLGPLNIFDAHTRMRNVPARNQAQEILINFDTDYSGTAYQIKTALDSKMLSIGVAMNKDSLVLVLQQMNAIRIQVTQTIAPPGALPINPYSNFELTNWLLQRMSTRSTTLSAIRQNVVTRFESSDTWENITDLITISIKSSITSLDVKSLDEQTNEIYQNSHAQTNYDQPASQLPYASSMLTQSQNQQQFRYQDRFRGDQEQFRYQDRFRGDLCRNYLRGHCNYGDRCIYRHSNDEGTDERRRYQDGKRGRSQSPSRSPYGANRYTPIDNIQRIPSPSNTLRPPTPTRSPSPSNSLRPPTPARK